ncbi:acyltransferase [Bradyrhizobium tropiciagri]|uniref:acyltransferase family protein n=1 Tax=Bradyrhizobium tropiciagri TaxID=312253 RepID=UPI001BABD7AC|nr:acyltransferase [Bradyrhizobium tropiciagri]MBR0896027.1 acyltransferase [Bradyrhizobium tropiciagri]
MGTLRFLLALCVVVTHARGATFFSHQLLNAITAVQAFYVISGFLITMVLDTRAGYRSVRQFYLSRYLRLWPAYAVVALLTLVVFKGSTIVAGVTNLDAAGALFVIVSNATIFFQDLFLFFAISPDGSLFPTTHFGTEPGPQLNGLMLVPQMWSVGVELIFYAIAPFVCRSPVRLIALLCIGLATRLAIGYWSPPALDPWFYRFAPAEMTMFAAGGLAYFAGKGLHFVPARVLKTVGIVCLAAVAFVVIVPPAEVYGFSQTLFLLNPRMILIIIAACPMLFMAFRDSRLDSMIGELSYPMYLSHLFVAETMVRYSPSLMTPDNFAYVCATVLFSAALLWLVILPIDRYRRRFGARLPAAPSINLAQEYPAAKLL